MRLVGVVRIRIGNVSLNGRIYRVEAVLPDGTKGYIYRWLDKDGDNFGRLTVKAVIKEAILRKL